LKYYFISILAVFFFFGQAQTKNTHLAGVGLGYPTGEPLIGYKGEINFNYLYAYDHFLTKIGTGMAPNTNFGTLKKLFVTIGFTTKLHRLITWQILLGAGDGSIGAENYITDSKKYSLYIGPLISESSFYVNPFKKKNILFALNFGLAKVATRNENVTYHSMYELGGVFFASLSVNYKLNRNNKE